MKLEAHFSVTRELIEKRIKRHKSVKAAYRKLEIYGWDGKTVVVGSPQDVAIFIDKIELLLRENWLLYVQPSAL